MTVHCRHALESQKHKIDGLSKHLTSINPKAVLNRGYSITLDKDDRVIKDSKRLHQDQKVLTVLHKGEFTSKVESVR